MEQIQLYNGDCLEVMDKLIADGVKVDAIITDPPYEVAPHGGTKSGMSKRAGKVRDEIDIMAHGFNYDETFNRMIKLCNPLNLLIFCSNKQVSKIMQWFEEKKYSVTLLIWHKTNPSPLCNNKYISDIEFIVYVRGKNAPINNDTDISNKYKVKSYPFVSPKQRFHPCEKPIALLSELINFHSFENQIILDIFMGSGSTGVACKKLNRYFIGIELDKGYFEIAEKRIEES